MENITRKLTKLKDTVESAKTELAGFKGQRKELMRRLKDEHGAESEKEAAKLLKKLSTSADTLEKELTVMINEIEEALENVEEK